MRSLILLRQAALSLVVLVLFGAIGEGLLRIKNADQMNYVVEMWRYARELKTPSTPELGHVHLPSSRAVLQNVEIATNSLGLRGPEPAATDVRPKIVLLGSSIVLGWGVPERNTLRATIEDQLGGKFAVYNAGIGNYNLARSVALFESRLRSLRPRTVVVGYFLRDAEVIDPPIRNILLENSQFATLIFHVVDGFLHGGYSQDKLERHYRQVYDANAAGYQSMLASLDKLRSLADQDGFDVILAMIPDIHALHPYRFGYIHDAMKENAEARGFAFVDLLPALEQFSGPELWAIPGDPHPNADGQRLMAGPISKALAADR